MRILLPLVLLTLLAVPVMAQTPSPSPEPKVDPTSTITDPVITDKQITNLPTKQTSTYARPDANTRFKKYFNGMIGPMALVRNAVSAGYATWRNSPEEWKPTWEGFGRRFASGMGRSAIRGTTMYVLDESFKLDSGFYRSKKKNLGGRLSDALLSTFTARKPNGKKVFGFPRIVGTYTASVIAAETWYPNRFDYMDGLKSGTISLGFSTAFSVFKEFFRK